MAMSAIAVDVEVGLRVLSLDGTVADLGQDAIKQKKAELFGALAVNPSRASSMQSRSYALEMSGSLLQYSPYPSELPPTSWSPVAHLIAWLT